MNNTYAIGNLKELARDKAINSAIGVIFFALAMVLGAYIRIPVPGTPVPITLQTFFVVLSGAVLGRRLGLLSQCGYIMLGVLGLPVFQGYAFGISHILGPTGGYLIGFIFAAYLTGCLLDSKDFNIAGTLIAFVIGNLVLYGLGILWLVYLYGINITNAVSIGALPFIPGEAIKIFFAVLLYSRISGRSKEIFHG